jgi:hypothetical protein
VLMGDTRAEPGLRGSRRRVSRARACRSCCQRPGGPLLISGIDRLLAPVTRRSLPAGGECACA